MSTSSEAAISPDGVVTPGHLQTQGDYINAEIERLRIEAGLQSQPVAVPAPVALCDVAHCGQPAALTVGSIRRCNNHPPQ